MAHHPVVTGLAFVVVIAGWVGAMVAITQALDGRMAEMDRAMVISTFPFMMILALVTYQSSTPDNSPSYIAVRPGGDGGGEEGEEDHFSIDDSDLRRHHHRDEHAIVPNDHVIKN